MTKVAIIGSGISGLFAGLILKSNNVDVKIFEKNNKIGGRIKMVDFDGEKVIAGAGIGRKEDKFKNYAIRVLGKEIYNEFLLTIGESDFEKADVVDTLYDYGFEK